MTSVARSIAELDTVLPIRKDVVKRAWEALKTRSIRTVVESGEYSCSTLMTAALTDSYIGSSMQHRLIKAGLHCDYVACPILWISRGRRESD